MGWVINWWGGAGCIFHPHPGHLPARERVEKYVAKTYERKALTPSPLSGGRLGWG